MSNLVYMVIGYVIGSIFSLVVIYNIHKDTLDEVDRLIELKQQCEETLPRNQTCELVARPKEQE